MSIKISRKSGENSLKGFYLDPPPPRSISDARLTFVRLSFFADLIYSEVIIPPPSFPNKSTEKGGRIYLSDRRRGAPCAHCSRKREYLRYQIRRPNYLSGAAVLSPPPSVIITDLWAAARGGRRIKNGLLRPVQSRYISGGISFDDD